MKSSPTTIVPKIHRLHSPLDLTNEAHGCSASRASLARLSTSHPAVGSWMFTTEVERKTLAIGDEARDPVAGIRRKYSFRHGLLAAAVPFISFTDA